MSGSSATFRGGRFDGGMEEEGGFDGSIDTATLRVKGRGSHGDGGS